MHSAVSATDSAIVVEIKEQVAKTANAIRKAGLMIWDCMRNRMMASEAFAATWPEVAHEKIVMTD